MSDAQLIFKIYKLSEELPKEWDALAGNNIFLSRLYLQALQDSAPKNMTCFFIEISRHEELVGIAICQFIDLSEISSFGERDHCIKKKIRTFVFRRFASKVLIIGNNMLTGQNTAAFKGNVAQAEIVSCLAASLGEISKGLPKKPHLIIWKDFAPSQKADFDKRQFKNYFKFVTQPNMVFNIRSSWHSADDYIADLIKKYRDQYKRARKKALGIDKRKLSLEDIRKYNTKIFELYMNVSRNAPFNTFYLSEHHFMTLKSTLKERFLFYGYFIDGDLIGFNTLIINGRNVYTYFLGYDEKYQKDKMLYLNMLYDMIGYSVNKKYKRIIFARTALEIKSSIGAEPVELIGYIKHNNPLINLFMPRLFGFFEPKLSWQERHPFKD